MPSSYKSGTTIVALRTHDAILIGSDSKVVAIDSQLADGVSGPKVAQIADMTIAHAGFFRDTAGTFNVAETAAAARSASGTLPETTNRFESLISGPLRHLLEQLESMNPRYVAAECEGKPVLSMLFAAIEDSVPKLSTRVFTAQRDASGSFIFHVHRLDCPGDCPDGMAFTSLGHNAHVEAYLDANRQAVAGVPLINTLIQLEIDNNPAMVGPPIRIFLIRSEGSGWIQ